MLRAKRIKLGEQMRLWRGFAENKTIWSCLVSFSVLLAVLFVGVVAVVAGAPGAVLVGTTG